MTDAQPAEGREPATSEADDQPAEDATSAQTREASAHDQAEGEDDVGETG